MVNADKKELNSILFTIVNYIKKNQKILITFISALLSVGIALYYIVHYCVNVPYYDEWVFVPLIHDYLHDSLTWKDLILPKDGHLILTQKLIALTSATLTGWDVRIECWSGFVFILGTAAIIAFRYRYIIIKQDSWITVITFCTVAEILFSLRQWENLLAPWSINFFAPTFFFCLSVMLIENATLPSFLFGFLSAILASISFTNGLIIWPIGFLVILSFSNCLKKYLYLFFWATMSAAILFLILHNSGNNFQKSFGLIPFIRFLELLGIWFSGDKSTISSLSLQGNFDSPITSAFGIIFIFIFSPILIGLINKKKKKFIFPLCIFIYGLISIGLIAIGHSEFGAIQALSSRYSSVTSLILIGVILLILELFYNTNEKAKQQWLTGACIALATAVFMPNIAATISEMTMAKYRFAFLNTWRSNVIKYNAASDQELESPLFSPQLIREWSKIMKEDNIGPFRDKGHGS